MKLYTESELLKKFKDKYIVIYRHYDYSSQKSLYEVQSVKNKPCENHNTPIEALSFFN